jgi:transposase
MIREYRGILKKGEKINPRREPTGQRGRTKQSKPTNLLSRLREYEEDVWRFATGLNVPFTNNLAEHEIRMPKVKQKISGCFRTIQGAEDFCIIRTYLATLNKQSSNLIESLTKTFQGYPPYPCFL